MAGLDASLYKLFGTRPRSVADYDLEAASVESAKQANALNALKLQQGSQAMQESNALKALYQQYGATPQALPGALEARGYVPQAAELRKQAAGLQQTQAQTGEVQARAGREQQQALGEATKRWRGMLDYIESPQAAAKWMQAQYADPLVGQQLTRTRPLEESIAAIPQDPAQFAQWRQQVGMGMDKFAELQRKTEGAEEALDLRRQQAATNEELRRQQMAQSADLRRESMGMQRELAQGRLEAQREAREAKAATAAEKASAGKPLPTPLVKSLGEQTEVADNTNRFVETFKPQFAGKTILGEASNVAGRILGDDTGQAQWWQDYGLHEAQVRNKLFGASLTSGEAQAWQKLAVTPRMEPKQVQQNLKRRQEIENRALERLMKASAAGGYSKEQIEALTGRPLTGAQAAPAGVDAVPKRIASDAEYNALPSGATFIGPDGKTRRKP